MFEGLGFSHEIMLINTNVGSITNEKQLKSNTYITENIELLVLISEPIKQEKYSENYSKHEKIILNSKNSEDSLRDNNINNKKDNLDLSSINTKGEIHSNFGYSETKNLLRDVLRLENPSSKTNNIANKINNINNNNNNINNENNNDLNIQNEEKIENDLFNEYLTRKQLFKEAKHYFPKTMKFQTIPSLVELKNNSYQDLRKVENFVVYNQHGKITFKGFTDITFLELDKIIKINPMEVVVYEKFDFPKVNEELNKPAVIEMFNYHIVNGDEEDRSFSISDESIEEHRIKVEESIKAQGGKLIEFDLEKKLLKFEVPYMRKSSD